MKKSTIILIAGLIIFCIIFAIIYFNSSDPVIIAPSYENFENNRT